MAFAINTKTVSSSSSLRQQHFKFFAVVDFEATCESVAPPPDMYIQEIIEFPIVIVDASNGTIIDSYQSYCRPVINPTLSKFCTQLTQETILSLKLNSNNPADFLRYLCMQCALSNIPYPKWVNQWIDIKTSFSQFHSTRKGRIADMLRYYRLQPQGHLHSGLDDAKNIGRIVIELIKNGCILKPTNAHYPKQVVFSSKQEKASLKNYDDNDDRMDTS